MFTLESILQAHTCQGCWRLPFQHTAGSSTPQNGNSLKASYLENKTVSTYTKYLHFNVCEQPVTIQIINATSVSRSNETAVEMCKWKQLGSSSVAYLHTKFTDSRLVRYVKKRTHIWRHSKHYMNNIRTIYIKCHYCNKKRRIIC